MPKMKSHSGASKRFKKTGSGKVKRAHSGTNHLFYNKGTKVTRKNAKPALVSKSDMKRLAQIIQNI